jgi:electron transfer flavoprotein beta subunit
MLAGILDYPQGTFISKLEVSGTTATVRREIENGTENIEITLPAILTADLHLNQPRFIKLPQLMMAKKKTIATIELSSINVAINATLRVLKVVDGEIKKHCKILNNVDEIITVLKEKKVLK